MSDIPAVPTPARPPLRAYLVIVVGIGVVSLAAIFIRLAQADGVPSLLIAASRLTIASLVLTPITVYRHWVDIRKLRRREIALALISGFFLAVHFATWIISLEYTNVLISSILVTTSPLWAALLEFVFLRAKLGRIVIFGLVIALAGGVVATLASSSGEQGLGQEPLLGSLLAVTGAVCVAVYFVIGRKLRASLNLLPYIWLVYGCAAIILLTGVLIAQIPITGYPEQSYLWMAAMALLPQLVGHSSFNFALKYFSATFVGIVTQIEPFLSAIIAVWVFQEIPSELQFIGSIIILVGIILAMLGQKRTG
jgi:drug/metabolite transporter (DMT)-like permease